MIALRRYTPSALAALALSCGAGDAHFETRFASGFSGAHHSVSVLGVYKDGRMSSESWGVVAERVARALGGGPCDAAIDSAFEANHGPLWSAIDDYTRANGPTDDLLAALAPAAQGDLVLILTIAGRLPVREKSSPAKESKTPRGGRGGEFRERDPNVFDVAASFYSVGERRSVAVVELEYSGASTEAALDQFGGRLGAAFPQSRCVGWTWNGGISPAQIRQRTGTEEGATAPR